MHISRYSCAMRVSMLRRIPPDIVRDRILPYLYRPQPNALRDDLRSYHHTMRAVHALYAERFPTGPNTSSDDSDRAWLSNDISRFLNNDRPIMLGYVDFYRRVFQRLFRNQARPPRNVCLPALFNDDASDIKVSIGLLLPSERDQLQAFLAEI